VKDAGLRTGAFTANRDVIHAAPPVGVSGILSPRLANAVAAIDGEVSQVGMPCMAASRPSLTIHIHPGVFGRLCLHIVQSLWQQGFRQRKRKASLPHPCPEELIAPRASR